ncbi:hypothetical protein ACAD35_00654 [Clavibacter nebraskensis]
MPGDPPASTRAHPPRPRRLLLRGGIALAFGALMIASRRIRSRRWAGAPRWVEVSEAAEDGELPRGADPAAWLAALERRRAEIRQEAWGVPIALVAVVLLAFLDVASADRALAGIVFLAVLVSWAAVLIAPAAAAATPWTRCSSPCRIAPAPMGSAGPAGHRPPPTTGFPRLLDNVHRARRPGARPIRGASMTPTTRRAYGPTA